jgi:hypothetical protein
MISLGFQGHCISGRSPKEAACGRNHKIRPHPIFSKTIGRSQFILYLQEMSYFVPQGLLQLKQVLILSLDQHYHGVTKEPHLAMGTEIGLKRPPLMV